MIRNVTIQTEQDLKEVWTDSNCPNIGFLFIEQTLEECLQEDGSFVATYETLEVPEGETMCFTYLTGSGETTYHLQPGEYGIKPQN